MPTVTPGSLYGQTNTYTPSIGGGLLDAAAYNPAAYGSVPQYPPTTTDTSSQTSSWTPQLPGYANMSGQASDLASQEMTGQLPADVIAQINEQAAQRGIATGAPGSANANAAYLQALGLTSLGLEQQGLTNYQSLLAGAPRTTNQTGSQTTSNANLIAEAAAAPNPYAAGMANLGAVTGGLAAGAGSVGGGAPRIVGGTPAAAAPVPVGYGAPASSPQMWYNPINTAYAPGGGLGIDPTTGYYTGLPTGNTAGGEDYYGGAPANTAYDPTQNVDYNTFGLPSWDTQYQDPGTSYFGANPDQGATEYQDPVEDQYTNPYEGIDWWDEGG